MANNSKDFVVININNSQEQVAEGDVITVNRLKGEAGDKIKFDSVLLSFKGGKTVVGAPSIDKAIVNAEIVEHLQGEKVHTRTYKSKSRYHKHVGQRAQLTKLKILSI